MTDKQKRLLKLAIRVAITSALLVWVFRSIGRQQFLEALKSAKWPFLLAVWAVIVLIYWFEAIKMRLILKKLGCGLRTATIFQASAVAALYSMFLPGMLSVGVKWYILKKQTGKGTHIFSGMVYNQFSSIMVMVGFGLGALIVTNPAARVWAQTEKRHLLPLVCAILLAGIVLFCLLLLNSRTGGKIINAMGYLFNPLPERFRQKAQKVLEQITLFQVVRWPFHLLMVLITAVGILVGGIVMYAFAAKAADITIAPWIFIWLWPAIFILQRIPISIANLGVREATLASLLPLYGVEPSKAVMMSMILFSALVCMAVIGGIFNFSGLMTGVRRDEAV